MRYINSLLLTYLLTYFNAIRPGRLSQHLLSFCLYYLTFVTGPPTHSVGGRLVTVAVVFRRLSSVFVVCRDL